MKTEGPYSSMTRPWLTCAALGWLALVCILGGVGLVGLNDVPGVIKAMPFALGVGITVLAADTWRGPRYAGATAADLEEAQSAIAGLQRELGTVKATLQNIRETAPLLPGTVQRLETVVRSLEEGFSGAGIQPPGALPGPAQENAIAMYRALLRETDDTLTRRFREMGSEIDTIGQKIRAVDTNVSQDVDRLRRVVETRMEDLRHEIERNSGGGEELKRRLEQLTEVQKVLATLSDQVGKYDPVLVSTIARSVANLEGIGSDTRAVLGKLETDLGRLNIQQRTIMEELKKIVPTPQS
ncbi:MAG: hypothetical protein HYY01_01355 [Chloroflexi bacterium]|nr:hypothetical protein [Chloroflexota bacterium]